MLLTFANIRNKRTWPDSQKYRKHPKPDENIKNQITSSYNPPIYSQYVLNHQNEHTTRLESNSRMYH